MANKVRIFNWAKENGFKSIDIVRKLNETGHKVRNHTVLIEEDVLKKLFLSEKKETKVQEPQKKEEKPKTQSSSPKRPPQQRSEQQNSQQRTNNTGQRDYNSRQGQTNNNRPYSNNNRPQSNNNRPQSNNNRPQSSSNRPYSNNNRPQSNNNRPNDTRRPYNKDNRPQNRPGGPGGQGNQQGYRGNRDNNGNNRYPNQRGPQTGNSKFPRKPNDNLKGLKDLPSDEKGKERTKTTVQQNRPQKQYDRFKMFDSKENTKNLNNAKTKTQLKKEQRKERQEEQAKKGIEVKWADDMTVGKLASLINIPATDLIAKLFELGVMTTINQQLDKETAEIVCPDYNVTIVEDDSNDDLEFENLVSDFEENDYETRPPIVTIMGHVDHGKTTLLDTLRNSNVTTREAGGITQHIGAYQIVHDGFKVTFLDTPGHEAFTAMRSRGANVTDITILVVAADDGVMPQTKEAIAHAKEAKTPLIVAVNKMDKPEANPQRVMTELAENGIMSEEWGGDVPFVQISALKGEGINELIDYIKMIADINDYRAPAKGLGYGTVIEAHLDKGRGPVATILMEGGELELSSPIVIGDTWGTIRAMRDEYGTSHKIIGPSVPVEITGLKGVPSAGDKFTAMSDVKEAQSVGEKRASLKAQKDRNRAHALSLDELNTLIAEGNIKELPVIVKADVQGSAEALTASLNKIDVNGVKARVVHQGAGAITESDAMLATASRAIIIGFNVRADANARKLIEKEKIELVISNIIYEIIEDIESSMKGMRERKFTNETIGYAKVDEVFKISDIGKVAGATVTEGKITRDAKLRLVRDGIVIYDGNIGQLKRYKDDVSEVINGQDCGISFKDFKDIKRGDELEAYVINEEELD